MWVPCQRSIKPEFAQNTGKASHSTRISRCGRRWRLFRENLCQWKSKKVVAKPPIRIDSGRTIVLLPNTRANDISVTIVSLLHCYSPSQIIASFMRILFWFFFLSQTPECAEILSAVSFSFSYEHFSKTRGGRSSRLGACVRRAHSETFLLDIAF